MSRKRPTLDLAGSISNSVEPMHVRATQNASSVVADEDDARSRTRAKPNDDSDARKAKDFISKLLSAMHIALEPFEGRKRFVTNSTPSILRDTITKAFQKYGDKVSVFLASFEEHCREEEYLDAMLRPVVFRSAAQTKENGAGGGAVADAGQAVSFVTGLDSLFKYFLVVQSIQVPLLTWILELLPQRSSNSAEADARFARFALNNIRWLSGLRDSEQLARKFVECMQACSPAVQREFIAAIPEVIDDAGHKITVQALSEMLNEGNEFTNIILETFSSLNLSPSVLDSLREDLLKRLDSLDSDNLPMLVRFLLQTAPAKALPSVVSRIREDLDVCSDQIVQGSVGSPRAVSIRDKATRAQSYQLLVFQAIRTAMEFDAKIAKAFITSLSSAEDSKPLDIWLLLIAHRIGAFKTKVETIFKQKVLTKKFSMSIIRKALVSHASVLVEHFASVVTLAERGIRSSSPAYVAFGISLYKLAFQVFSESFCRQEVISNILSHVGSKNEAECSAGLDALLLCAQEPLQLKPLWPFLETVLDAVADFSRSNMRKAWRVFSLLIWVSEPLAQASQVPAGGESRSKKSRMELNFDEKVHNVLSMVLRKQLTSARHSYKRSGVIGTVVLLGQIGAEWEGVTVAKPVLEESHSLLTALFSQRTSDPAYMALAMDELSMVIQAPKKPLSTRFLDNILDRVHRMLESGFLRAPDTLDSVAVADDAGKILYDLTGGQIRKVFNIWHLTARKSRDSLIYLCPLIRLLCAAHSVRSEGDLSDLHGFAVMPLLMHVPSSVNMFDELEEEVQQRVALSLFYGINLVHELINAFCQQKDAVVRGAIVQRLTHLCEMESQLERVLTKSKSLLIPDARDPTAALGAESQPAPKKAKPNAKSGGKSANSAAPKKAPAKKESSAEAATIDFPLVRSHAKKIRALDFETISILAYQSSCVPDENVVCHLQPFAISALVRAFSVHCQALFEPQKEVVAAFARKTPALEVTGPYAGRPRPALSEVIVPMLGALNEQLARLGDFIGTWKTNEGARWMGDEDGGEQRFDHESVDFQVVLSDSKAFWCHVVHPHRLMMEVFRRIFTWLNASASSKESSEEEAKQFDALSRQVFAGVCQRNMPGSSSGGGTGALADLKREAWNYLVCLNQTITSFSCALTFAQLLESVATYGAGRRFAQHQPSTPVEGDGGVASAGATGNHHAYTYYEQLSKMCRTFLESEWPVMVYGASSQDISPMLEMFLNWSQTPTADFHFVVSAISKVGGVRNEEGEGADDAANEDEQLKTLTGVTLTTYFKTTFRCLIRALNLGDWDKCETWSVDLRRRHLQKVGKFNREMSSLVLMCKMEKVPAAVLMCILREGKTYIESLRRIVSFFPKMQQNAVDAMDCVRRTQTGTRTLQRLCGKVKVGGEKKFLTLVPPMKRALEKLVLELRRISQEMGFGELFQIGALKFKDLDGQELDSQVTYAVAAAEEEEEEENDEADKDGANGGDDDDEGEEVVDGLAQDEGDEEEQPADSE